MHINIKRPKEHSGESFILWNQKDWMNMWSACALKHAAWRTNRKKQNSTCSYKVTLHWDHEVVVGWLTWLAAINIHRLFRKNKLTRQ